MLDLTEREILIVRTIVNRLLAVNYLVKHLDREIYSHAFRYKENLQSIFKLLGWTIVFDDRNDVIFVTSTVAEHKKNLQKDETIWLLILRLIYQEKRQNLMLSEFPITTIGEIRSKYDTFQLDFLNKTRLQDTIRLATNYQLIALIDNDYSSDVSRLKLFHSLLHAVNIEEVSVLYERIQKFKMEGFLNEMAEENSIN